MTACLRSSTAACAGGWARRCFFFLIDLPGQGPWPSSATLSSTPPIHPSPVSLLRDSRKKVVGNQGSCVTPEEGELGWVSQSSQRRL